MHPAVSRGRGRIGAGMKRCPRKRWQSAEHKRTRNAGKVARRSVRGCGAFFPRFAIASIRQSVPASVRNGHFSYCMMGSRVPDTRTGTCMDGGRSGTSETGVSWPYGGVRMHVAGSKPPMSNCVPPHGKREGVLCLRLVEDRPPKRATGSLITPARPSSGCNRGRASGSYRVSYVHPCSTA